jgi:hypothetical protein
MVEAAAACEKNPSIGRPLEFTESDRSPGVDLTDHVRVGD